MWGIGKCFHHHKDSKSNLHSFRKKDRARAENAHMHAALSIAGLASALAAVAVPDDSSSVSKMSRTVASATKLLASHCIEIPEQAGADHGRVASAVRSTIDIQSLGYLMTLTAAAVTALRAEATLRSRLPKDAKRNAAISPHDKALGSDASSVDPYHSETEEPKFPCVGELMQHAKKAFGVGSAATRTEPVASGSAAAIGVGSAATRTEPVASGSAAAITKSVVEGRTEATSS